jgi:hypothetical protein
MGHSLIWIIVILFYFILSRFNIWNIGMQTGSEFAKAYEQGIHKSK